MKNIKPTESELEILSILWERGACTVRDVHDALSATKEAGYTTTLKLMQIMHEKGLLQRDASSKTHIYTAAVSQEKTQEQLLNKMIDTVFGGSASRLVLQALGNHRSSNEELDKIREYLAEMEKNQKR
ncbi:MAG TPA: BlaI/MecI/CopY family transcriptional regulator [Chitinophaga sp.]|uniref:BlaI/MecI/CopY family transcriptional regulator n=1 Tax=Chitinophaga sp. TaxID=1869181 RepID=UPI002CBB4282|nr:BlaI/MecI/CopY family transcriptional regulator [Chitinophaga sp.]HVI47347.1 BlaI/MecI/CopY family transcriptional regulator [Chitinophaga sp.]